PLVLRLHEEEAGEERPALSELGVDHGESLLQVGDPLAERGRHLLGRQRRQERERGGELGALPGRRGEHLAHPLPQGLAAELGGFVDGALRPVLLAGGLPYRDQPVPEEPVDGLVDAVALRDVDHIVLVPLLDQLLHAVRVHRFLAHEREQRHGQWGSSRRHGTHRIGLAVNSHEMYSRSMTMKALIIGGGIAGPVAALALRRAGIDSEIYEEYDRGAEGVGAFLTLAVNGLEALRVLNLYDLVRDLGVDTPIMEITNGRGRRLAVFEQPSRTIKRADLYRVLRDEAVRAGVPIHYGKRLTSASPTLHGVRAYFADGTQAEGDLLIGADGLRSRTRMLIDPEAPRARYVGLLNTGGFADGVTVPGRPGVNHFVFGRRCFFGYLIHPDDGQVWWFANPPSRREPSREELAEISPQRWRALLLDLFEGDEGPMQDSIRATETIPAPWITYDFPSVPKWYTERMIIIGDAAHARSPAAGQGASEA